MHTRSKNSELEDERKNDSDPERHPHHKEQNQTAQITTDFLYQWVGKSRLH